MTGQYWYRASVASMGTGPECYNIGALYWWKFYCHKQKIKLLIRYTVCVLRWSPQIHDHAHLENNLHQLRERERDKDSINVLSQLVIITYMKVLKT